MIKKYRKLEIDLVLMDYLKKGILKMEEKDGQRFFYTTNLINDEMKRIFPKTWWIYLVKRRIENFLNVYKNQSSPKDNKAE